MDCRPLRSYDIYKNIVIETAKEYNFSFQYTLQPLWC